MQQIYTRGLTGRKLVNKRNLLQLPQLTRDAKSIERLKNWGLSPKKRQPRKSEKRKTKQANFQKSFDMNAELTMDISQALSQCSENKVMVKTPSVVQLAPKVGSQQVKQNSTRIGQFPSTFMSPSRKNRQIIKSQNPTPLPLKLVNELTVYR